VAQRSQATGQRCCLMLREQQVVSFKVHSSFSSCSEVSILLSCIRSSELRRPAAAPLALHSDAPSTDNYKAPEFHPRFDDSATLAINVRKTNACFTDLFTLAAAIVTYVGERALCTMDGLCMMSCYMDFVPVHFSLLKSLHESVRE
jgi:hypothetical protein